MIPLDPNGIKATGATMSDVGILDRAWDWIAYDLMQRIPMIRRLRAAGYARRLERHGGQQLSGRPAASSE